MNTPWESGIAAGAGLGPARQRFGRLFPLSLVRRLLPGCLLLVLLPLQGADRVVGPRVGAAVLALVGVELAEHRVLVAAAIGIALWAAARHLELDLNPSSLGNQKNWSRSSPNLQLFL